jgi:hypothetical protein
MRIGDDIQKATPRESKNNQQFTPETEAGTIENNTKIIRVLQKSTKKPTAHMKYKNRIFY